MLHAVPAISRTFLSWQLKFGPIVGSSVLMFLLRNYIYPRRVTFLGHGILYHKCSFFVFSIHAEEDLCRRFDMFRLIRQNLKWLTSPQFRKSSRCSLFVVHLISTDAAQFSASDQPDIHYTDMHLSLLWWIREIICFYIMWIGPANWPP